jgi:beta-lactamase superfamily II metal-dependent hydrolase
MASDFRIHMLDMGYRKYGDCTVIQAKDKVVLIDGAHAGDYESSRGIPSIPEQLEAILDSSPPFEVSLLVVTHGHSDHIGCLPRMVSERELRAEWALVIDERLGFGHLSDADARVFDDAAPEVRRLVAALREESWADVEDPAMLEEFLSDAATVEDRYRQMLRDLEGAGTRVFRYGVDRYRPLTTAFRDIGLRILGPTHAHLRRCAEQIRDYTRDAIDTVSDFLSDAPRSLDQTLLYRSLVGPEADAADQFGKGSAINDQSIVLRFEVDDRKILMAGDMQFADAQVRGLERDMSRLREKVAADGPFAFVRASHHGSYNGLDESLLAEWGETRNLGFSSGRNDAGHPSRSVLRLLREHRDELTWARTDKNGVVRIDIGAGGAEIEVSDGRLNDTRANVVDVPEVEPAVPPPPPGTVSVPTTTSTPPVVPPPVGPPSVGPPPVGPPLPVAAPGTVAAGEGDTVEVLTKIPHVDTRVTITIEVHPGELKPAAGRLDEPAHLQPAPLQIGGGRQLPPLLFATSRGALSRNIGTEATNRLLGALRAGGQQVLDSLPDDNGDAEAAASAVREALRRANPQSVRGVVVVGGYDVVPSEVVDVLDPDLRARLTGYRADSDDFIVWSDDVFGDLDGDGDAELPVSRIPDGRSADLVFRAVQATRPAQAVARFGIRNIARPFAEGVFASLPGRDVLLTSEPTLSNQIAVESVRDRPHVYLMLHGADRDGTRFWGENGGSYPVAFALENVLSASGSVVFTGCCWGALTTDATAREVANGRRTAARDATESIALRFLDAGALAYVGCTGTHYSPVEPPYDYFGGPLHQRFWYHYLRGKGPAEALFQAKLDYLGGMPHGRHSSQAKAIELKIFRQFTCLGLGW